MGLSGGEAGEHEPVQLPLALVPVGSVRVTDGVSLVEDGNGDGTVLLWGQAAWCWDASDPAARRLAAVQLVNSAAADQRAVASAFGVNETTVWRWRADYARGGVASLLPALHGPKGPSKLTKEKCAEIVALRAAGKTLAEVAHATGVSPDTVRRAHAVASTAAAPVKEGSPGGGPFGKERTLVVLNRPEARTRERGAARRGELDEAAPVITEGAALPFAGTLTILPTLGATGLLDVAAGIYGSGRKVAGVTRAAFYGLRSLVLCVVFSAMLGEPRAEGAGRIDPVAIGRLLGLDRAIEVSRLRFRLGELAGEKLADRLVIGLARRHTEVHPEAVGLLYVDGHVRAYNGAADVQKAHVARMRIAMPGECDTWVTDRFGDGLLVWQAPPGASLVGELRAVTEAVRALLGQGVRPTICFDRGGWSPKLFAELDAAGFDVLTYQKGKVPEAGELVFAPHRFIDESGRRHDYLLSDRPIELSYDSGHKSFPCRQIARLDETTGHRTEIVTTRTDPDPAALAYAMFGRWREENFFRYMRAHYGLDALDAYASTPDDKERLVANPARKAADRRHREAVRELATATARQGEASLSGQAADDELAKAFAEATAEVARLGEEAKATPAKVRLGEVRPTAVRIDVERKRIMDAIRMATYNAESALARLLRPHYARADDEARSLLREIFRSSADLEIEGDQLHVRILALSAPRRTKALAKLCQDLTATETLYPGTELTLVYSVKEA